MNRVSRIISTTGFQPMSTISRKWVFTPSAAMAATRHQRDAVLPASRTNSGIGTRLLNTTRAAKAVTNQGSSGGRSPSPWPPFDRAQMPMQTMTGRQHRDTHQLDHGGGVAGLRRNRVTRADDLGDVMDCRADEHAGMVIVEAEQLGDCRVEDHRDGRQGRHADDREAGRPLLPVIAGSAAEIAIAADAPQIAVAPPDSRPNSGLKPIAFAAQIETRMVSVTTADDERDRLPAQRGNLPQGDAEAEQRDAKAEHGPRREVDPGLAAVDFAEEVHRHAEQQGEQHHRPGIMIGKEGGRRRNHQ